MDFESLSDVLKHQIRRRILLVLYEKGNLSYVELMGLVEAANTGKFNYHLKILGDLIKKDTDGKYCLTEKGQTAAQLLQKFPEKKQEQVSLCMADATLIGFAGMVLTVVNPVFWFSLLVALLKLELAVPLFVVLGFLGFVYALIVPGVVMRVLTVRRTGSHDMYDLLKPPFVTFILILLILIVMFLLKINLTLSITSPAVPNQDGGYSYSIMQTSMHLILLFGLVFSFLGVVIAESAGKLWRRIMS